MTVTLALVTQHTPLTLQGFSNSFLQLCNLQALAGHFPGAIPIEGGHYPRSPVNVRWSSPDAHLESPKILEIPDEPLHNDFHNPPIQPGTCSNGKTSSALLTRVTTMRKTQRELSSGRAVIYVFAPRPTAKRNHPSGAPHVRKK